jgi:hypothetical protein
MPTRKRPEVMDRIDVELAAARADGYCVACGRRENIDPGKAFCEECDEEGRILLADFRTYEMGEE